MKKNILLILTIVISTFAFGQKKEIFRDDFNNNHKSWSEQKGTEQEKFFRNGQYYIINKKIDQVTWTRQNVIIDPKENFIIETSVALNWEKEGSAILIFGEDNGSANFHCMKIYKKTNKKRGYKYNDVYIGKHIDGEWVGVWKKARIKDFGQQNILTVKKKDNQISFFVNGRLVYTKGFEPFFGNGLGMGSGPPQNVSFDYIVVKQNKQNISNTYIYETKRK